MRACAALAAENARNHEAVLPQIEQLLAHRPLSFNVPEGDRAAFGDFNFRARRIEPNRSFMLPAFARPSRQRFALASLYLAWSQFGSRLQFDVLLRFRCPSDAEHGELIRHVLDRYCRGLSLIDLRSNGDATQEFAYHVKLTRAGTEAALLRELEQVRGVDAASLYTRDASLEL